MSNDSNSSEIKVLIERMFHFSEKLSDIKQSIDKMDANLEKVKEEIKHINEIKIPSITEELSGLRVKAAVAGGIFGAVGAAVLSFMLWVIQGWHH